MSTFRLKPALEPSHARELTEWCDRGISVGGVWRFVGLICSDDLEDAVYLSDMIFVYPGLDHVYRLMSSASVRYLNDFSRHA